MIYIKDEVKSPCQGEYVMVAYPVIGLFLGFVLALCRTFDADFRRVRSAYRRQAFNFRMKTSRIARDTAKVAVSFSQADYLPRRQTRAFAASLQSFTANGDASSPGKKGVKPDDTSGDDSSLSSVGSVFDIEDVPFESSTSRKRKRGLDSPSTALATKSPTSSFSRTSPHRPNVKPEGGTVGKRKKAKRQPAKRIVSDAGEIKVEAPANWEEIYDAVREMRKERLAPVDTMGCETLAEEHLTPHVSQTSTDIRDPGPC